MTNTAGSQTHTPGPWYVVKSPGQGGYKVLQVGDERGAVCYLPIQATKNREADAALIAAAPALLAALKGLFNPANRVDDIATIWVRCLAAIAKAEGRA